MRRYTPFVDNFTLELLLECSTEVQADIDEERMVLHCRSNERKYGYNLLRGAPTKLKQFWYLHRKKAKK